MNPADEIPSLEEREALMEERVAREAGRQDNLVDEAVWILEGQNAIGETGPADGVLVEMQFTPAPSCWDCFGELTPADLATKDVSGYRPGRCISCRTPYEHGRVGGEEDSWEKNRGIVELPKGWGPI